MNGALHQPVWRRALAAFLPVIAIVAVPLLLRKAPRYQGSGQDSLVIVTPHNESIRYEFAQAFRAYYHRTKGRTVAVDWRAPGGTSQIARYLDDQFLVAFRRAWLADPTNGPWTGEVAGSFNDRKLKPDRASSVARKARETFLASNAGIGIDLFFGGGQYEMSVQAGKGYAVDAGLAATHPGLFDETVIPARYSGETFYDADGRYYGACLSSFGICYNRDRVAALGDAPPPARWADLGEPRFNGQVAVADPTKSGSITKCFEMLIQEQMADAIEAHGSESAPALATGWAAGLNLIKRIGGNARYITDSAGKVPRDVGTGDIAVGMCIDFYGRTQAEWTGRQSGGEERVVYVTPRGGSSISVDPIQLLRGAPNREVAVAFIEFVLSPEGQKLWNYRVGTPGGPVKYALRRLPVRRDMYTPEHRQHMADAQADPYHEAAAFTYRGRLTGPYFGLIRNLIRCMVLDPLPELQAAWQAIVEAGGPDAVPGAMEAFNALPFDYQGCADARNALNPHADGQSPVTVLHTMRGWTEFFRDHYRVAAQRARDRR